MNRELNARKHIRRKKIFRFADSSEKEAIRKIASALSTLSEIEKVVVFGSRVRGDFDAFSDLDVLVVVKKIAVRHRVIHALHEIEIAYDIPLSPVIYTIMEYAMNKKLKSKFIANVEREGIIIYDAHRSG